MYILRFNTVIGAILAAFFAVGCTKSENPTVHFLGYKGHDRNTWAITEITNPGPSQIVCEFEVQPKDAFTGVDSTVVPARSSQRYNLYVNRTNNISLNVTFFKVVPTSHMTVPMQ